MLDNMGGSTANRANHMQRAETQSMGSSCSKLFKPSRETASDGSPFSFSDAPHRFVQEFMLTQEESGTKTEDREGLTL